MFSLSLRNENLRSHKVMGKLRHNFSQSFKCLHIGRFTIWSIIWATYSVTLYVAQNKIYPSIHLLSSLIVRRLPQLDNGFRFHNNTRRMYVATWFIVYSSVRVALIFSKSHDETTKKLRMPNFHLLASTISESNVIF